MKDLYDGVILYWLNYAHLVEEFEKKLKPKIKGRIHMNEIVLKERGKKMYGINAPDGKMAVLEKFFESLKKKIYMNA